MKKILFATDLSPTAENAFTYAVALAKSFGAVIDIVHVYTVNYEDGQYYAPYYIREVSTAKENSVLEQLDSLSKFVAPRYIGRRHALQGLYADRQIIELSFEGSYDLLIMGTKGAGNALQRMLGSTTTRVMTEAGCPVLVIPASATYHPIEHITYATVYEPSDFPVVEQLINLAEQLNASVQFLHVNDKEVVPTTDFVKMTNLSNRFAVFSEVTGDSVEQGLHTYMDKHPIDLLALYIPQRSTWEQLFHTSFTKKMVFHTDTPLLIFHQ